MRAALIALFLSIFVVNVAAGYSRTFSLLKSCISRALWRVHRLGASQNQGISSYNSDVMRIYLCGGRKRSDRNYLVLPFQARAGELGMRPRNTRKYAKYTKRKAFFVCSDGIFH